MLSELISDMDYQDRSEIIFNEIKRAHSAYKLNNGIIKIYHIGRNKKRIFDANVYLSLIHISLLKLGYLQNQDNIDFMATN